MSDAVLADVLRQLMFTPEKAGQKFVPFESVDYADLSVQQLGSIYEGLLEHHFVRENGKLTLKTDKAERKATGTYYTPDYIVKYIVENTLGPLLQEIEQRDNVKAALKAGRQDNSFANEVLKLNVCDPAMGSGHFLVEATIYLADHAVYHSTTKFQAEFAKGESQERMEISYWRRRVVEACIYGVDLNPLAVELAKLSLWLTTIASDQPLNFLDHHLCCGNSLIGARLDDLSHVPDKKRKKVVGLKLSWKITENLRAALTKCVQMVHNIEGAASASVSDVKNKEKLWLDSIRPALLPFRTVANLWTACFFGNDLPQENYEALIELLDIHPDKIRPWKSAEEFQNIVTDALKKGSLTLRKREFDINQLKNLCAFLIRSERSGKERRFFHWELEFPEVFFNDDGTTRERPGFDAVIGNPPYGATLDAEQKEYTRQMFETSTYNLDTFSHFFEKSARWLWPKYSSMIIPNTWLTTDDGHALRKLLLTEGHITSILDTGNVFAGVIVDTVVVVLSKEKPKAETNKQTTVLRVKGQTPAERLRCIQEQNWFRAFTVSQSQFELNPDQAFDIFLAPEERSIVAKIRNEAESLDKMCDVARGARAYGLGEGEPPQTKELIASKAFHSSSRVDATYFPHLTASEVHRYQEEPFREWLRYGRWLAVKGEWRFFSQRRVLLQRVIRLRPPRFVAALITGQKVNNTDVLNLISRDGQCSLFFILALLSARLLPWYESKTNVNLERAAYPKINVQDAAALPIRRIKFTTPAKERTSLHEKANQLYQCGCEDGNVEDVLSFVAKQLTAKPERADVIHDILAFLAERMVELNKEKQTAAKKFLTDLKDFHGIDVHALKPKTKLDEFWKLETSGLFAHFYANKLRLKAPDEEKIRDRFQKSKEQLIPLETQIRFTDELIDQIVYRLYGLTEDEIKIVEGRAS